jgi:hypothetical protein
MKRNKVIYLLVAGLFLITSCELNKLPVFDDKDAFISFDNTSLSAPEESGSIRIPVTLSSLAGLSGTVTFEVDATSTAQAGVNYTVKNSSSTLTFTKESPTQYIDVELIDNDIFTGDKVVAFTLTGASINLGANATARLVIADNEHPLLFILGTYEGKDVPTYRGAMTYEITVEKDDEDISKVWISGLEPYMASAAGAIGPFSGVVNEERTEIRVTTGQETGYSGVTLEGLDDPDWQISDFLPTGATFAVEIHDDGATLVIPNAFGAFNAAGQFYNIVFGGAKYTKK